MRLPGRTPQVTVPVLLIAAEKDLFFPMDLVQETAELVTDCSLVWLDDVGHLRAAISTRAAGHLLAFVNQDAGRRGVRGNPLG